MPERYGTAVGANASSSLAFTIGTRSIAARSAASFDLAEKPLPPPTAQVMNAPYHGHQGENPPPAAPDPLVDLFI